MCRVACAVKEGIGLHQWGVQRSDCFVWAQHPQAWRASLVSALSQPRAGPSAIGGGDVMPAPALRAYLCVWQQWAFVRHALHARCSSGTSQRSSVSVGMREMRTIAGHSSFVSWFCFIALHRQQSRWQQALNNCVLAPLSSLQCPPSMSSPCIKTGRWDTMLITPCFIHRTVAQPALTRWCP